MPAAAALPTQTMKKATMSGMAMTEGSSNATKRTPTTPTRKPKLSVNPSAAP